jgi:hypothetical protein
MEKGISLIYFVKKAKEPSFTKALFEKGFKKVLKTW